MSIRVYIVEDHEDMRLILKRTLKKNFRDIEISGESETGEQALEDIPSLKPDLVLVDVSLPGIDGIELIRQLRPTQNGILILVVTGHSVELYKDSALKAGAQDIVSKSDMRIMIKSIRQLLDTYNT